MTFAAIYDFIPRIFECLFLFLFRPFIEVIIALSSECPSGPVTPGSSTGSANTAGDLSTSQTEPVYGVRPPADPIVPANLGKALFAVAPHLTDAAQAAWTQVLTAQLTKACITPRRCVAAFLGQCCVESGGFRELEEDLSYSAGRLCEVWPNRFPTLEDAEPYAFHPEALANNVYADRMGNGDSGSGDGWRFRGRGLIQLTGRTAYERFANSVGMTLDDAVEHAATPEGAAESASWFWSVHGLNALAEQWLVDRITQRINGGLTDATERSRLCSVALRAIGP